MADYGVTSQGFRRPTYFELLDAFEQKAKELFGADINLTARSKFGLMLRIFAWFSSQLWQLAEDVYNAGYVDTSTGISLSRIGGDIGIRPYSASKAVGELTFTGTAGVTVPAGMIVKTAAGIRFVTLVDAIIGVAGIITVSAQAYETGVDGNVASGTITSIVTPITGIDTVTNAAVYAGGRARETEAEFRARYYRTAGRASGANTDAIREELLTVIGVQHAQVYANNSNETDENGLPAHSIEAVVYGGADLDVAKAIWKRRAGGIDTYGSSSAAIVDAAGYTRQVNFSRPEAMLVYVHISDLAISTGYELADVQARLQAALITYINALGVGVSVSFNRLIGVASAVEGVDDFALTISPDDVTYSTANIAISVRQTASTDAAKVVFV